MLAICSSVKDRSFGNAFVRDKLINASCGRNRTRQITTITITATVLKTRSTLINLFCVDSPVNGMWRYALPCIISAPLALLLCAEVRKKVHSAKEGIHNA